MLSNYRHVTSLCYVAQLFRCCATTQRKTPVLTTSVCVHVCFNNNNNNSLVCALRNNLQHEHQQQQQIVTNLYVDTRTQANRTGERTGEVAE